jgi:2-oxoglutarate dehydrogenase E2 component (dihydrolipoamide succinyltransferase)
VARDEQLATVETDKVDVTVNAQEEGKILEFFAGEGDTITVGGDLYKIDTDGKPDASTSNAGEKKASQEST